MMCAHLAAIKNIVVAHALLHEGMAALAAYRHTAVALQNSLSVPGQARVKHNLSARLLMQKDLCQQANDIIAFDKICLLIKQEAAVKVAVPGDAQISTAFADNLRRSLAVRHQQRIRYTVGEGAVRSFVQRNKFKRQMLSQLLEHRAGTAIAGISNDFHRLEHARINIGQKMLDICRHNVHLLQCAQGLATDQLMLEIAGSSNHLANLLQTGITGNWTRITAHQLHAVIFLRIVAGSYHNAAISLQMSRGKINHLGTALTDIYNLCAAMTQALGQRINKRTTAQTDIMTDNNSLCCKHCRKNTAHAISHLFVNLGGIHTAYIVSLKSLVCYFHCYFSFILKSLSKIYC